jgi:hypothetical protein
MRTASGGVGQAWFRMDREPYPSILAAQSVPRVRTSTYLLDVAARRSQHLDRLGQADAARVQYARSVQQLDLRRSARLSPVAVRRQRRKSPRRLRRAALRRAALQRCACTQSTRSGGASMRRTRARMRMRLRACMHASACVCI